MVGLVAWGTSAMRTQGDDVAEILALIGVRPMWHPESRRVTGIEVIPLEELGRPRIDVTVRISGFFRDAFPHLVVLLDDAIAKVAALDEPADQNYVAAHAREDAERLAAELGQQAWRQATMRVFGSKPGTYGAGLLQLVDARDWRGDADIAAGLRGLGRLRLRPRAGGRASRRLDARVLRPHRGRGQERRFARARHPRLRRLLPVPRRHGRDRTRAHRARARRLPGRQLRPLARGRAQPGRGDAARLPRARRQPALDRVDDPPRLQGRRRAVRDRRLPVRLRRDDRRGRGLDVRAGRRSATCSTTTSPSS